MIQWFIMGKITAKYHKKKGGLGGYFKIYNSQQGADCESVEVSANNVLTCPNILPCLDNVKTENNLAIKNYPDNGQDVT